MRATFERCLAGHRRAIAPLLALVTGLGLAACGSSGSSGQAASSNPSTLLRQTFAATHQVKSGVLDFSLVVDPHGSSELTTPLSLLLSGPFQNRGHGKTPESSFSIAFDGLGKKGSLGVTTTASGAYVALGGASYALPSADFKKLQSTLGERASTNTAPGLSSLGIDPERWVSHPQIVGTATVDGVLTEHLHADVDVKSFVESLNKVLAKDSSTLRAAGKVPSHITAAEAAKIAGMIHNPSIDVWSAKRDSTLRRLQIGAVVPVHGSLSSELGGLTSASFRLTVNYADLDRPQTISTPTDVHSYAALETKLRSIGEALSGVTGLGSTSSSSTGSNSGTSGSPASVTKYAKCINGANGDVAKMQRCAKLLSGG